MTALNDSQVLEVMAIIGYGLSAVSLLSVAKLLPGTTKWPRPWMYQASAATGLWTAWWFVRALSGPSLVLGIVGRSIHLFTISVFLTTAFYWHRVLRSKLPDS